MGSLRNGRSVAPCAIGMLAVGLALSLSDARAQTIAALDPDLFTIKMQSDSRNPPRFQKFDHAALEELKAPPRFIAPASGAGTTGFDSTNTRKAKSRTKPKTLANAQAIAPGVPVLAATPPGKSGEVTSSISSSVPGSPPVQLGPIRTFPKKRKPYAEPEDPYAPLGIRTGAFIFYPAVELIGGYDTNPGHEPNGSGASFYTVAPELSGQSDWSRHDLKIGLRGSYVGFSPDETPSLSRPYLNGKVDGRIDVAQDTRVDVGGRVVVSTDNPGSPNLQAGLAKLPIYVVGGGGLGLGQRFNRFDLSIKGDFERTVYQQSLLTDGTTVSNDDRNYDQYAGVLRGSYELSPGLTPFAEVALDTRLHDLNTDSSGYQRNSNGLTGKAGSKFEFTPILTGEAALGYTQRVYEDPRLANISGPVGNVSLLWIPDVLTSVKLLGASTIGESTVPGVSGVFYRTIGVQVDHAFRRWLIGTVKLGFEVDNYVGLDRVDKLYSVGAGLTYKLNRSVQIKGEFRQNWLRSNVIGVDYTESILMFGLRFQR